MFKVISSLVQSLGKDSDLSLADRYHIDYQIGKGGMGEVYKAIDKSSGDATVAIKFLSQAIQNEAMCHRFEKEAKISALLGEQSHHIVKVRDYGFSANHTPYYVMEYLEGYDLDQLVKKKSLSVAKFLFLTRQICLGLECAHQGILVDGEMCPVIHRDIKPSNIFLAKNSEQKLIVKILDFGVAQINKAHQNQTETSFMGTAEYCSPEQMAEQELKPTSDIYSLGVLMYKMLTQKYPIKAEKYNFQAWYKAHQELIPPKLPSYLNLPTELDNMIMKCLAKSPAQRPPNIGEILRIITPLEREYNQDKSSNSIKVNLGFQATNFPSLVDIYRQSSWPADKPQQKIVFPSLTEAQGGKYTSLWTMLDREEVEVFTSEQTFCFNHFLFQSDPHPLVLWVNLLYNRNYKPKWLPCYLDLKTSLGEQIMRNLVSQKVYHLLLFAREKPQKYQELITVKINQDKVKQLQSFLEKSLAMRGKKQPEVSKIALKKQFELVKQTILDIIHRNQS